MPAVIVPTTAATESPRTRLDRSPDRLNSEPPDSNRPQPVGRAFKLIASVAIIWQLWAVIGRPIEFATQGPFGPSPSATLFRAPVRLYSQFAYLDHGYAFFAPDPGPSHLIQAAITDPTGERSERTFPDLNDQRPRLLYHRHFMLAEFLNDIHHPPGEPPPGIAEDPQALRDWRMSRRRYEAVRDSILAHLRARHPDAEVAIRRIEHRQPGLPEYFGGNVDLNDERLYQVLHDVAEIPGSTAAEAEPINATFAPFMTPSDSQVGQPPIAESSSAESSSQEQQP